MTYIARRADAVVLNLAHTGGSTLLDNVGGEIDLIVRRSNARTELNN